MRMDIRTLRIPSRFERRRWIASKRRLWQRIMVISTLFVATVLAALVAPEQLFLPIVAAPIGLVGLYLLLRWPPIGFIVAIVGALFVGSTGVPIEIPFIGFSAAIVLVLTGLWIFHMVAHNRQIVFVPSGTIIPILFFTIVVLLSYAVGQFPWFPVEGASTDAQMGGMFIFLVSFFAFLIVAHQVRDIRWLEWMVYPFLIFAGIIVLLTNIPGGRQFMRIYFHGKSYGGSLFWVWVVALSGSQMLFNRKLHIVYRLFFGLVLAGALYVGLVQNRAWVSGWVPPLVALIVVFWLGAPKIALPATIAAVVALALNYGMLYDLIFIGDNEYSTISRLDAWRVMGEIIMVNPVLGVGPANYYFYTPLFNILGFYVQFNSHNNYIDILAQTGFAGLICYFWFMIAVARLGWRLMLRVPRFGFAHAYVLGCLGGLAASLVAGMLGDWVIPFVFNIGIEGLRASANAWMYWGGLVALEQIMKAEGTL